MTQDEIIEMAKQAHRKLVTEVYVGHMGQLDPWTIEFLKIFAALVEAAARADEREECAKLCDDMDSISDYYGSRVELICAEAIRARGTT
jgi:hypothetical protein